MAFTKESTFNSTRYYSYILGVIFLVHLVAILFYKNPNALKVTSEKPQEKSFKIVTIGVDDPTKKKVIVAESRSKGARVPTPKPLSLEDLNAASPSASKVPQVRPGRRPLISRNENAESRIVFNKQELKKMVQESYAGQTSDLIARDKVSLSYEIPNGKKLDELNEAELRLYSFFKRGAQKYTASVMSELNSFNLQNPHLQFPMTEEKQVMTGRLTYDSEGNLKQIKMVRWTNIDKLQGFFENVMKRMDVMQNPPKELWEDSGEFTVFVTLQINE